jgi:hypothetical protein
MCSTCSGSTETLLSTCLVQAQSLEKGPYLCFAAQHFEFALGHHALCTTWAKSPPKSKMTLKTTLTWTTTLQQEARRLQVETTTASENTEAADFGSDTSPRTESGDYEELSQAEAN